MIQEAPNGINSFASAEHTENEPPGEPVFILTSSQIEAIIKQAMAEHATRIKNLERIIEIYISPDPKSLDTDNPENIPWAAAIKKRAIASRDYGCRLLDLEDKICTVEGNQSATQLKRKAGKKAEERMLKLAITILNRKNNPLTYSEVGKILELGTRSADGKRNTREQNMTHFGKRLEAATERFIVKHNATTGGKQVCLTKIYYDHLAKEYIG